MKKTLLFFEKFAICTPFVIYLAHLLVLEKIFIDVDFKIK